MGVMGCAEIYDKSFDILRKYIKTISLYVLTFSIIILLGITVLMFFGDIINNFIINGPLIFIVPLGIIFLNVGLLCFNAGIIKIASQEFLNKPICTYQAIKASIKSFFTVIRVLIAAVILFLPIIIVLTTVFRYFILPKIMEILFWGFRGLSPFIILIIIYLIAAIMLIFKYIVMISLALHAAIIEERGGFSSIKKSYRLVKKNFWKIFGCIILFMLSVYAIYISLQVFLTLILSLAFLIMSLLNIQLNYISFMTQVYVFTRWLFFIINCLIISPLITIMMTNLYFNQRFKKEGFDLTLRLEQLVNKKERKLTSDSLQT